MWSADTYQSALRFAAIAHQGQRFPGTELPYLLHVAFVAGEVMAALSEGAQPLDGDLAVQCALLHDVIEDTKVTPAELRHAFGDAVADGVQALSKDPSLPHDLQMQDSLDRIRRQPREVWMVKLADRISNLQAPPPHWTAPRIAAYAVEAELIRSTLQSGSPPLARRLADKIKQYKQYY